MAVFDVSGGFLFLFLIVMWRVFIGYGPGRGFLEGERERVFVGWVSAQRRFERLWSHIINLFRGWIVELAIWAFAIVCG